MLDLINNIILYKIILAYRLLSSFSFYLWFNRFWFVCASVQVYIFSSFNESYVYTLRLIGPISYLDECDLMVHPRKYIVIFSRMHYLRTYICIKIRNRPTSCFNDAIHLCMAFPNKLRLKRLIII